MRGRTLPCAHDPCTCSHMHTRTHQRTHAPTYPRTHAHTHARARAPSTHVYRRTKSNVSNDHRLASSNVVDSFHFSQIDELIVWLVRQNIYIFTDDFQNIIGRQDRSNRVPKDNAVRITRFDRCVCNIVNHAHYSWEKEVVVLQHLLK